MSTRDSILDTAQAYVQSRGFNAFSFRDIADEVGIRTASIYHYFPSKADLGREVIRRYRSSLMSALAGIERTSSDGPRRLDELVALLAQSIEKGDRVCLCGILMSDCPTLDEEMRTELISMLEDVEAWLASVLKEGRAVGELQFADPPAVVARTIFASLQGIMMAARAHGEPERFRKAARALVGLLKT